jgi:hypothetical protein
MPGNLIQDFWSWSAMLAPMNYILTLIVIVALAGCSPSPNAPSQGATPNSTPLVASPEPVKVSTPVPDTSPEPGALIVGQDPFGREQMKARDGMHEVSVSKEDSGSYTVSFKKWVDLGGGAESASGLPVHTDSDKAAEGVSAALEQDPAFRPLGVTVVEALLSGEHEKWQLKAEDKENVASMLEVLKN